jgi:hypothetical protein
MGVKFIVANVPVVVTKSEPTGESAILAELPEAGHLTSFPKSKGGCRVQSNEPKYADLC